MADSLTAHFIGETSGVERGKVPLPLARWLFPGVVGRAERRGGGNERASERDRHQLNCRDATLTHYITQMKSEH